VCGLGCGVESEFRQGAFTQAQKTLGKQLAGKWTGIGCRNAGQGQGAVPCGHARHVGVVFDQCWNTAEQGKGTGLVGGIKL